MIGTPVSRLYLIFILILPTTFGLGLLTGCSDTTPSIVAPGDGAVSLDVMPLPRSGKHDLATTLGIVDEIDYAAMRLRIGHVWFRANGDTEFKAPACASDCSLANIQADDLARVKYDRSAGSDGVYYALEVEVEEVDDDDDDPEEPEVDTLETEGLVEAVEGARVMVSGTWFWTDAATNFEFDDCTGAVIQVGSVVKVEHTTEWTDGLGLYAFKIEVRCSDR